MVKNFFNQTLTKGVMTMDRIKSLNSMKPFYQYVLKYKKWHTALRSIEQQAKYMDIFEKQSLPSQPLPEIVRIADMAEQHLRDFTDALEKLDPHLKKRNPGFKHPPPPARV
jgi:hypothetical protein